MRQFEHDWGGKLRTWVLWVLPIILITAATPVALAAEAVLTLDMALSRASTEHTSVESAKQDLESANLAVEMAESENKLKLSTSLTPFRYSSARKDVGESVTFNGSLAGLNGLGASAAIRWDSDSWLRDNDEADVTVGLSLDLWPSPKYSSQYLSLTDSKEKAEIARAELSAATTAAVVEAYKTYRLLQIQEARVSLAKKTFETQSQSYQQVADKYAKGLASRSDVLSAQAEMEKAKSDYNKAARDLALDIAQFAKDLGLDQATNWKLEPLPETINKVSLDLSEEEAIRLAEQCSASVKKAEQAVKAAERSLAAAAADKGLEVSLTGSVSVDREFSDPTYGAYLSVNYDLFDGGKRKIQVEQLRLALAQAQKELENARYDLAQAIQSGVSELEWLSDQVEIAYLNFERAQLEYQARQAQRQQGLISSLELAEAETQMEKSRLDWLEAIVNYEAGRLNLLQQTGQALDIEGGVLH